ncbi:MAG: hypothetical protein QNL93_00165 [Opitutae bacterium]
MKGSLFIIIGTPDSARRSTLSHTISENEEIPAPIFLLPQELELRELPGSKWKWKENEFELQIPPDLNTEEFFLFFSNKIDLSEQIEGLLSLIEQNENLTLERIITFINSKYLMDLNDNLQNWLDACAHFSDAFCFSNRLNENSRFLSQITDRYKDMRYPLETFILGNKKLPPLDSILAPISKRMTHIFDPHELLEPEDSPENDPFISKQPNGKRTNIIPQPFKT